MLRRLLIKIHAYLGLFCAPYLVIFAVSSLNFNHEFMGVNDPGKTETFEKEFEVTELPGNEDLAALINDSLGIMGWYIPWDAERDSMKFRYETVHFGKRYDVDVSFPGNRVEVLATAEPPGNIIKGLHFLGERIPGAPWWINAWKYYQDLTVYSLVFWIVTGIYFWATKSTDSQWGTWIMAASLIFSFLIMIYIWVTG